MYAIRSYYDVASRNAKAQCDMGKGVGETGFAVYLDFKDAIKRDGKDVIAQKYGNLFQIVITSYSIHYTKLYEDSVAKDAVLCVVG